MTVAGEFTDLGEVGGNFQGGFVVLQGYGCPGCGNGFWTEGDNARRLDPERHTCRCPHCGEARRPPRDERNGTAASGGGDRA